MGHLPLNLWPRGLRTAEIAPVNALKGWGASWWEGVNLVLEFQVGFVMAILGLTGCLLFPLAPRIRGHPELWVALFAGVILYDIIHDITDALLAERIVAAIHGPIVSLGLVVLGVAVGLFAVYTFLGTGPEASEVGTRPLVALGLLLAIHATVDGFVIGDSLRFLGPEDVFRADAIALQVIHRFLEGGALVAFMLFAGSRKQRIFAATFYVGLPMAATTPLGPVAPPLVTEMATLVLAFAGLGVFLPLFLQALWPAISREATWHAASWVLVGFLIALIAHGLAH